LSGIDYAEQVRHLTCLSFGVNRSAIGRFGVNRSRGQKRKSLGMAKLPSHLTRSESDDSLQTCGRMHLRPPLLRLHCWPLAAHQLALARMRSLRNARTLRRRDLSAAYQDEAICRHGWCDDRDCCSRACLSCLVRPHQYSMLCHHETLLSQHSRDSRPKAAIDAVLHVNVARLQPGPYLLAQSAAMKSRHCMMAKFS
jgi:hypothetical protein